MFKKIKQNPQMTLVIISIAIVIIFTAWQWIKVDRFTYHTIGSEVWFSEREFTLSYINYKYNSTFQRVLVFGGIVYTSIFMILYVWRKK